MRLTVLTAGHERKHNACRADIGGCVSGYTYISRVKSPQNLCRGSVEEWTPVDTASAGMHPASAASALEPGEMVAEGAGGGQRDEEGLSADVFAGRFAKALHDFAANRDAAHRLSVGERESLAVDNWLTKCKIDKPDRFSGESAGCGELVKYFLSEVIRYFAVTGLPVSSWGVMFAHFLKGAALLSW